MKIRSWRRRGLVLILLITAAAVGCGARSDMGGASAPMADEEAAWSGAAPAESEPQSAPVDDVSLDELDRMIVYTGELSLVVEDSESAMEAAIGLAEEVEGYLASASSNTYAGGQRRVNLTLRVPAAAFNEAMEALRELAIEVTYDSVASEDVTQEYVDLESRLTALEAKASRLEELMDEAEDTEAVLAVYEELSETQIAIEEAKGRLRYLERRATMATITVTLTPDELARPVEVAGWRPQGTARRAIETLVRAFQFLADALIWIVLVVVPVLGVIGLAVYVLVRVLRAIFGKRRRNRGGVAPSEVEDGASDSG